ncbi:MAG: invasion associated locus B family protein [Rhodovarius sp.]|nr:invasion associated locus B family protein [Rhodovarius sp.]
MRGLPLRWAALSAAWLAIGPAAAQDRSLAAFGDWLLRCEQRGSRLCEIATPLPGPEGRTLAQVLIGRIDPRGPLLITAHLPLSVHLPAQVRVMLPDGVVSLTYQHCLQAGCFATAELDEGLLRRLRAEPQGVRLAFQDGARREITAPVSMSGFARAHAALIEQTAPSRR